MDRRQRTTAAGERPRVRPPAGAQEKGDDVLSSLWAITARGNNAEVRQRDGRLIVYEVRKQIAVG